MSVSEQNMSGVRLAAFDATLENGKLYVDVTKLAAKDTLELFNTALGFSSFTINNARIGREKNSLAVTGTANVFENDSVSVKIASQSDPGGDMFLHFSHGPVELLLPDTIPDNSPLRSLVFEAEELVVTSPGDDTRSPVLTQRGSLVDLNLGGVVISQEWKHSQCTVRWTAPKPLIVVGIEQLSINQFSVALSFSASNERFSGQVRGNIHIGNFMLPVKMPIPSGGEAIRLIGEFPPININSTGELLRFLDLGRYSSSLTRQLETLTGLSITDIDVLFNPKLGSIPYLAIELSTSEPWQVVPSFFEFRNTHFELTVLAPARADRSLSVGITGDFHIGTHTVHLQGELADTTELIGSCKNLSLRQFVSSLLPNHTQFRKLPDLQLNELTLQLSTSGDLEITGDNMHIDFQSLASALSITVPDGLSGVAIDQLRLSRDGDSGAVELHLSTATHVLLTDEHNAPRISGIVIEPSHEPNDGSAVRCQFRVHGSTHVCRELSVHFDNIDFDWDQRKARWLVNSDVLVDWLGAAYQFQATVESRSGGTAIVLRYANELELSDIGGYGSLTIKDFSVFTERHANGSTTSNRWGVSGATRIAVASLFDASGQVSLQSGDDGTQLQLSAAAPKLAPIALPLDLPTTPVLHISLSDLHANYFGDKRGQREWRLSAGAKMQIRNIPKIFTNYLPSEELSGYLRADKRALNLGFDVPSTLQPDFPELALTFANETTLSLGKPVLRVDAIELHLGEEARLVQRLNVTLPSQLNDIFGTDEAGKANLDLFNSDFKLALELAKKPTLRAISSPLKPLEFYQKDYIDGQWTRWDFGSIGKVEFRVPEFSLSDGRWNASGGFNRLTDIHLPLRPVKFLLEKCGLAKTLTSILPKSLPLKDIDLTGENFAAEMKQLMGDDVLGSLDSRASTILSDVFTAMTSFIDRLPNRLQVYLQLRTPKSALFDISVDATGGGTSIALRTLPEDPPLRLLFPMMLGLPELTGLTLRGFSLGQKMGGALAIVEVDGYIDRFDMVSLTGALALNRDVANRYYLEQTTFVVPTGLPIPVPLFFSRLGLDYQDVLGFNMQARWSYPNPQLGVSDTVTLFSELLSFFTNSDYLLHREGFANTLGLQLTVGKNFITLPDYLGGQTLGLTEALPTLSVGDSIARFLDFLKTGNSGYAITAIPLQHDDQWIRLGSEGIHFGPIGIEMSWCVSTESEFVDVIVPASHYHGDLPVEFDNAVLKSLPTNRINKAGDNGFVILLSSLAEFGDVAGIRTEFGIAATAHGGFETGFRMIAEIGRTLSLQIGGKVEVQNNTVEISGHTGLYWNDKVIAAMQGRIAVSEQAFKVDITIDLTSAFSVQGTLMIGQKGFFMRGDAAWRHGANGPSEGISASIHLSANGMTIECDWRLITFDALVRIHVPGDGNQQLFSATVVLLPDEDLQRSFAIGITSAAKSIAENSVDDIYNKLQTAIADVESLDVSICGLREWLPDTCTTLVNTITTTINTNTTGWKRPGRPTAHKIAKPFVSRLATLGNVAKNAADLTIRTELKQALDDIINNNHLKIRVGAPALRMRKNKWGVPYPSYFTRYFTVYQQDLMDRAQINQLKQAVANIDRLPARDGLRIETQTIYDQLPQRDRLLGEINREIRQGVSDAVPIIESIEFATKLQLIDTENIRASVRYSRGGVIYQKQLVLDISDPNKTTDRLIRAFGS